ncbi:hypothetical protein TH66_00140 [Carbonactinospora thermoautotrophica]|uniref:Plasmid stabilization protein n=1 Tax=Carbonactinospora thermoautotrophica TaxID=1469144 RepID=A0A132N3N0_9ACTN|nr:type II toxin-antitoxin system RelE/ParE family toxin [Carbonactinospora thermoautotrophica]KWX04637.1 hypothetical protein TR74_24255 [Carbonactinospora thermoautotrophica]KWX05963.1 hypothetical protein TH66_00140 [Carbonactinospora thermoautotrophica]
MPQYKVEIAESAIKQLRRIDKPHLARIRAAIDQLATDPRPNGCKLLKDKPGCWRIRVGDYRIIYTIEDDRLVVTVIKVGSRGDVYDRL